MIQISKIKNIFKFIIVVGLVEIYSSSAYALKPKEYKDKIKQIKEDSKAEIKKVKTQKEANKICEKEQKEMDNAFKDFNKMEGQTSGIKAFGQPKISGSFPVANFQDGDIVELKFNFLELDTLKPVSEMFLELDVKSVLYEVNLDDDPEDLFTEIGRSSDINNEFFLQFTISGFESLLRARPLNEQGQTIFIAGSDGDNLAEGFAMVCNSSSIPESTSPLSLLALGTLGAISILKRKKN